MLYDKNHDKVNQLKSVRTPKHLYFLSVKQNGGKTA